jgi:hypothetical protein
MKYVSRKMANLSQCSVLLDVSPFRFLTCEEFSGNASVTSELSKLSLSLDVVLLPHFFPAGESDKMIPNVLSGTWFVKSGKYNFVGEMAAAAAKDDGEKTEYR